MIRKISFAALLLLLAAGTAVVFLDVRPEALRVFLPGSFLLAGVALIFSRAGGERQAGLSETETTELGEAVEDEESPEEIHEELLKAQEERKELEKVFERL
ncbi:MAG: hypothetical protein JW760_05680, partial [Spirochaetales bacterium]|nr:hypothetical protein [Spirochaetales bacterium]